ncbi:MAG: hypothetical protein Q4E62_09525, partial [Sutterellaceae bacterium]|nr:hypothetical protein [Sutterellaceae bacterium]
SFLDRPFKRQKTLPLPQPFFHTNETGRDKQCENSSTGLETATMSGLKIRFTKKASCADTHSKSVKNAEKERIVTLTKVLFHKCVSISFYARSCSKKPPANRKKFGKKSPCRHNTCGECL